VRWIPILNGSGRVVGHLCPELLSQWPKWALDMLSKDLLR
jgi:hypothetical protein